MTTSPTYKSTARRHTILTLVICAACIFGSFAPVRADSATSVAAYLKVKHTLGQTPLTNQALGAVTSNPDSYSGRALELSGTVTGQVVCGSDRTVLITVQNSVVSATLPESLRQSLWIDVGSTIRALFTIQVTAKDPNYLRIIAAAPDADLAAAEQREALVNARKVQVSRYMSYSRTGTERETVAGGSHLSYNLYQSAVGDDGGHPSGYLPPRARQIFGAYHAAVHKFNKRLRPEDVDLITNSILFFADQDDIDPRLLVAMIIAESDFNIFSTSRTGAMGLGQLMPATARGLGIRDAYDPEYNIWAAARILRGHLDKYGGAPRAAGLIPESQLKWVMAAYNAGPGAVRKYHGVPPYRETQKYVKRVAMLYKQMCGG